MPSRPFNLLSPGIIIQIPLTYTGLHSFFIEYLLGSGDLVYIHMIDNRYEEKFDVGHYWSSKALIDNLMFLNNFRN